MSGLVVIAAHGPDYVDRCVASLGDVEHLVVSTDPDGQAPGQYCTGAYLWAYRNTDADEFIFIQDSMTANADPWPWFRQRMPGPIGAVAWGLFSLCWADPEQAEWTYSHYPDTRLGYGIFGPIFYTNRATLDLLHERNVVPPTPTSRWEEQGNERGWALAFAAAGVPLAGEVWSHAGLVAATCGPFHKVWGGRE